MNEFESFDNEANAFDDEQFDDQANNFAGKKTAAKRQMSSFDLAIVNSTAQIVPVELFNTLNSATIKKNAQLAVGTYAMVPQLSLEGLAASGLGIIGWNQDGKLIMTSTVSGTTATCTVSCNQFPYRGLFESIVSQKFIIRKMRITFTTNAQIDNAIVHFKSSFFGSTSQNTLSPREFFDPTQQQGLIVDVKTNLPIDGKRGLLMNVNAGETVRINFQVERLAD